MSLDIPMRKRYFGMFARGQFGQMLRIAQGDTIIILRALGRHHIDEVVKISEEFRRSEFSTGSGGDLNPFD